MWGDIDEASPELLKLHLELSDRLSHLSWERVQIWRHSISVHSFRLGNLAVAFDVLVGSTTTTVTLVSRDSELSRQIRDCLRAEDINFTEVLDRPDRSMLAEYTHQRNTSPAATIVELIASTRQALERSVRKQEEWTDPETGLQIRYSVKPERKGCSEVIFVFTSIRTRAHWLDFNGPLGQSVKPNRARMVFLQDTFDAAFTYHLAINGDDSVSAATARFIEAYITSQSIDLNAVTLAGMSKGATSAIIIGSMLSRCTVVALAPQLCLGDYLLSSNRFPILTTISGLSDTTSPQKVDSLMWNILERQKDKWGIGNLYILTSHNDPHCTDGLPRLRNIVRDNELSNVSVAVVRTDSIRSHLDTVHHLSPLFLSLLGIIASGIRPTDLGAEPENQVRGAQLL